MQPAGARAGEDVAYCSTPRAPPGAIGRGLSGPGKSPAPCLPIWHSDAITMLHAANPLCEGLCLMYDQIIALIVALACSLGTLSQYDQPSTDEVLANRSVSGRTAYLLPDKRDGVTGYIAVYECERIGEVVTVSWSDHVEKLMVFDCAGDDETRHWMKQENVIGEVDYYTARRWDMLGRAMPDAILCPAEVGEYRWSVRTR
jgi:hypothetical protein